MRLRSILGSGAASVWPQTKRIGARAFLKGARRFGFQGSIRLAPDQTDRRSRLPRVFSGLRPEARHTPRRPCGLPHGLGVSDPSPCAPPRQALCTDPFEHSVEGFCGAARVEWAGPVWTKKQVGAGTDMRVFSAQPKAGTLPGDT